MFNEQTKVATVFDIGRNRRLQAIASDSKQEIPGDHPSNVNVYAFRKVHNLSAAFPSASSKTLW